MQNCDFSQNQGTLYSLYYSNMHTYIKLKELKKVSTRTVFCDWGGGVGALRTCRQMIGVFFTPSQYVLLKINKNYRLLCLFHDNSSLSCVSENITIILFRYIYIEHGERIVNEIFCCGFPSLWVLGVSYFALDYLPCLTHIWLKEGRSIIHIFNIYIYFLLLIFVVLNLNSYRPLCSW